METECNFQNSDAHNMCAAKVPIARAVFLSTMIRSLRMECADWQNRGDQRINDEDATIDFAKSRTAFVCALAALFIHSAARVPRRRPKKPPADLHPGTHRSCRVPALLRGNDRVLGRRLSTAAAHFERALRFDPNRTRSACRWPRLLPDARSGSRHQHRRVHPASGQSASRFPGQMLPLR